MKSFVPRVRLRDWTNAEESVEHEGWSIDIYWRDFIFEICVGRAHRRFA